MLRSNKAQDILSCLASIPNLCVLASVDHVNASLLWDQVKRSKFNFFWWDTTTFLSYQEETSYESSLLVQQSGSLALSSLRNVFLSLTSNAKSIYVLLATYQLNNNSNVNFTGMAFKDLYRAAREEFLVSSDLALCYHCGGGLKDWAPEDDPWEQLIKYRVGTYRRRLKKKRCK